MRKLIGPALVTAIVCALASPARADDKDVTAVLDKAIKALGGEEKLAAAKAVTWKSKGKLRRKDQDSDFTIQMTFDGLDKVHQEFEGEFGGNKVKGVAVQNGDKGWRVFGDMKTELDKDALANQKRTMYLQVVAVTIVPLKGKDFKTKMAGEEKVGDRPAVVIEVTGPDGKDFKMYFDKESGLPVKQTAKVAGLMGGEFDQETTYGDYKEFAGIKKATKVASKRNGEPFIDSEITDFKVLDKVDAKTFDEPK
ncbi:MAG TPA: hypothetical protein VKE40_15190 [Gemmataceae bacterium]|nr:hypothetical protein [Gemmataceae bacterium]